LEINYRYWKLFTWNF